MDDKFLNNIKKRKAFQKQSHALKSTAPKDKVHYNKSVQLDPDTYKKLRYHCFIHHVAMAEIASRAVRIYLDNHKGPSDTKH